MFNWNGLRRSVSVGGGVRCADQRRRQPDPVHVHDTEIPATTSAGLLSKAHFEGRHSGADRPKVPAPSRGRLQRGTSSTAETSTLGARCHWNEPHHKLTTQRWFIKATFMIKPHLFNIFANIIYKYYISLFSFVVACLIIILKMLQCSLFSAQSLTIIKSIKLFFLFQHCILLIASHYWLLFVKIL